MAPPSERQDLGGKVVVRLEGAFDNYPQNLHLLANAVIYLARWMAVAVVVLALALILAAAIVAGAVR